FQGDAEDRLPDALGDRSGVPCAPRDVVHERRTPRVPYTPLFRSMFSARGAGTAARTVSGAGAISGAGAAAGGGEIAPAPESVPRSEEHTSELQSREKLVCRLLLEKKKRRPRASAGK